MGKRSTPQEEKKANNIRDRVQKRPRTQEGNDDNWQGKRPRKGQNNTRQGRSPNY